MRTLVKRGGYAVLFCLAFGIGQSKAGDSTYLEIRKIGITDTFVLKSLGHYVDSLKKLHVNDGKWYLSLFINNGFEQSDTAAVITVGCVDYPINLDRPDREFPNYYAVVNGVPVLFEPVGRLSALDLSGTTGYSEASKKELIGVLKPFLPPPQLNYPVRDKDGKATRTYDEYWPDSPILLGGLELKIVKFKDNTYKMTMKRSY
jgi:hypothetical protein